MSSKHRSLTGEEQEDQEENKEWSNVFVRMMGSFGSLQAGGWGKMSRGNLAAMPKGLRKGEVPVSLYSLCHILGQVYG